MVAGWPVDLVTCLDRVLVNTLDDDVLGGEFSLEDGMVEKPCKSAMGCESAIPYGASR
jgi:hypothetical protein